MFSLKSSQVVELSTISRLKEQYRQVLVNTFDSLMLCDCPYEELVAILENTARCIINYQYLATGSEGNKYTSAGLIKNLGALIAKINEVLEPNNKSDYKTDEWFLVGEASGQKLLEAILAEAKLMQECKISSTASQKCRVLD